MLAELGNDLKNILLAGVGAVAVTAEKSEEILKELVKKGELTVEQGKALNEELKHKIRVAKEAAEKGEPLAEASKPEQPAPPVDVAQLSCEERAALLKKLQELEAEEPDGTEDAAE